MTFNFAFERHSLVPYQTSASLILEIDMKMIWDLEDDLKIFPFFPSIFIFLNQLPYLLNYGESYEKDPQIGI